MNFTQLNYSDEDVVEQLTTYDFPSSPFGTAREESEKELRVVARYISMNLIRFVKEVNNTEIIGKIISLLFPKTKIINQTKLIEEYSYKDLIDAKTLKRSFSNKKFSKTTLNIFRAFLMCKNFEYNKQTKLAQIEGFYYILNSHNTRQDSFQISMLEIDKNQGGTINYKNRNGEHVIKEIKVELIGDLKVLITVKDESNFIVFYLYIGPKSSEPAPYLQAVYINANRSKKTMANIAIFKRVHTQDPLATFLDFVPERESSSIAILDKEGMVEDDPNLSIRKNVQYFLINLTKPIVPVFNESTTPFNFAKEVARYPSTFHRTAKHYQKATDYVGDYFIYFPENYASNRPQNEKYLKTNNYYTSVGRGILKIRKDEVSGILECKFESKKLIDSNNYLAYSGFVVNHELNSGDTLILALYMNQEKDKYINFILSIADDHTLIGNYSVIYSVIPKTLGTGTVIAVKQEQILREYSSLELKDPSIFRPTSFYASEFKSNCKLEEKIIRKLSIIKKNLTMPPLYEDIKDSDAHLYHGVYLMYNYEIVDNKQLLRVSILRINSNDLVTFVSTREKGNSLVTHGYVLDQGTTISLVLENSTEKRFGFFAIKVGNTNAPSTGKGKENDRTAYLCTFAGFSRGPSATPIATKYFVKFMGKDAQIQDFETQATFLNINDILEKSNFEKAIFSYFLTEKQSNTGQLDFNGKRAYTVGQVIEMFSSTKIER